MLPPASFADPAVLDWEIEHLYGGWVCLGHASLVAEAGSYLMREIGETTRLRAWPARTERRVSSSTPAATAAPASSRRPRARSAGASSAPTTRWSYGLDGTLAAAPHMDAVEDFDRSCFGLIEVRSAVVSGLLMADLSGEAGDPVEHVGDLARRFDDWKISRPSARRLAHVRGRRELEGDRRELQRVPPLPGRPPGAERALRLPLGQLAVRAGRLVRRLDGAERRRRDDGPQRPRATGRPSRGSIPPSITPSTTSRSSRTRSSRSIPTT